MGAHVGEDLLLDIVRQRHLDWEITRSGGGVRAVRRGPSGSVLPLGATDEVTALYPRDLDERLETQDALRRALGCS